MVGSSRLGVGWRSRAVVELLLNALLPPQCLTCEAEVTAQGTLCAACFRGLSIIGEPQCSRCGVPFAHLGEAAAVAAGQPLCFRCWHDPPLFRLARAALRYDEGAKSLLLPFKHADRLEMAPLLARLMVRAGAALLEEADVIAAIPAHWARLIRRRYDQAAVLARHVGREVGLPVIPDLLYRCRRTPPLRGLAAAARAEVVAGAFALPQRYEGVVRGAQIILVDDVLTSGATANACAAVLRAAGAKAIDILAAARVTDPHAPVVASS